MGTHYSHLSEEQRIKIEVLLRHGASSSAVASYIGCHRSTVWREQRRGWYRPLGQYLAHFGQRYCLLARARAGRARRKLGENLDSPAWQRVRQGLRAGWSPQQIAGRLRAMDPLFGLLEQPAYVSHETIYCAIYAMPRGALRTELVTALRRSHAGRLPRARGKSRFTGVQEMTPIALRPPEVAARVVPGHWEGDLIKGAGNRSAVGTLVERTSRLVMLVRLDAASAPSVLAGFKRRLQHIPPAMRRTLTYDQGSEMALHKQLATQLHIDIFFCDAHSPWQRGSNENANGLIREYLPKGMDLSQVTEEQLHNIELALNNRPRRILGYRTPQEVFDQLRLDHIDGVALQA